MPAPANATPKAQPTQPQHAPRDLQSAGDINILVIDDDPATCSVIQAALANNDFIIDTVSDPALVESNIVIFAVPDPAALVTGLAERGIEVSNFGPRVRAVTHLDVDRSGVEKALAAVGDALS